MPDITEEKPWAEVKNVDVEMTDVSGVVSAEDDEKLRAFYESYEYTLVFPMAGDDNEPQAPFDPEKPDEGVQTKFSRHVINALLNAGFKVYTFLSIQKDELYALVTISQDKLARFADKTDFKMHLSGDYCKNLLATGSTEHRIKPVKIADEKRFSHLHPFQHIYGKYDCGSDQKIYKIENSSKDRLLFDGVNKLKLMYNMMVANKRDGGCRLDIQGALLREDILSMYPSHNSHTIKEILDASNNVTLKMPWNMPVNRIRDYVGEKMALFYVFLGHQSYWLIIPMILGVLAQGVVWSSGPNYSHPVLPFFGVFASIWAITWLQYWSRKESFKAMEWGMIGFESTELERPQFKGDLITSPVNGQFELWYPHRKKQMKMGISLISISTLILLVLGTVTGIYVMRFQLQKTMGSSAATVASVLNSVQITIFNLVYSSIAVKLNDNENHKTDTQYQDSLIVKVFLFQFVNSYISFFYIAFIALFLPHTASTDPLFQGQCGYYNCMKPLATNLAILYATRLTSNNILDVVLEWYAYKTKVATETHGTEEQMTPPELEYCLLETDPMNDTIALFADVAIQFGFSLLFVTALPICFAATFISNMIRIKMSLRKMLQWHQRPIPMSCEDIGTWYAILCFISYFSVLTNGALVCFTMDILKETSTVDANNAKMEVTHSQPSYYMPANLDAIERVWMFLGWCAFGLFFQGVIAWAIDCYPKSVTLQLQRQDFIVSKIIEHMEDDDYDEPDVAHDEDDDEGIVRGGGLCSSLCGKSNQEKKRKAIPDLESFRVCGTPRTAEEIQNPLSQANDWQQKKISAAVATL